MGLGSSKKEKDYFDVESDITRIDIRSKKLVEIKKVPELPELKYLNLTYDELTSLPPSIGTAFPKLESLILCGNHLKGLPESLSCLENLHVIDVSKNRLNDLSNDFRGLVNLQELVLYSNRIENIPESFSDLVNLRALNLCANQLRNIGSVWSSLTQLTTIDFSHNNLSQLDPTFKHLTNITYMNLSGNDFNEIPAELSSLISLTSIDFTLNKIESLSKDRQLRLPKSLVKLKIRSNKLENIDFISECEDLEEILMDSNCLKTLPNDISKLKKLRILHLYVNSIKYLPDDFGGLTSLKDFDISSNRLAELPASFANLSALNIFFSHSNQISSLNDDFFIKLPYLSQITFTNNRLKKIPSSVNQMTSLFSLELNQNKLSSKNFPDIDGLKLGNIDLGYNLFKQIPMTVYRHQYLAILNVFGNNIKTIEDSISNLTNLRKINLSYNQIQSLPDSFSSLQELMEINISGNRMKTIPQVIFSLPKLRILSCSNNQIKKIDENIEKLSQLKDLHLDSNEIKSIDSLYSLTALEELNLSHNKIESIGTELSNLSSLQWIDISGNCLKAFEIDYMQSLTHLKLLFNEIVEKPMIAAHISVVDTGNPFNERRFKKKKNKSIKINESDDNETLTTEDDADPSPRSQKMKSSLSNSGKSNNILRNFNYRNHFGWAETRGRRPEMQDSLVLEHGLNNLDIDIFGLFDGHAGSETADLCASTLVPLMEKILSQNYDNNRNIEDLRICVSSAIELLHKSVVKSNYVDGTAALIGLIIDQHGYDEDRSENDPLLVIANSGDQRIVLCENGVSINLTKDHKPDDVGELNRIKNSGGFVSENKRVNGILALSRAVGDVLLQPHVTYEPQVVVVNIKEEMEFIIIACDGLWDVISSESAVKLIKDEMDPLKAAVKLKDYAYSLNSTDNISVIVYRFKEVKQSKE